MVEKASEKQLRDIQSIGKNTSLILWQEYKKYCNEPRNESLLDNSAIPCLVKMSDGEIWNARWVFDFDWHNKAFTGWMFRSMWGEYYILDDEEHDCDGVEVVAFAYMKDIM